MGAQKVDFDAISDSCANLTSLTESVDKTIDVVDSAVNRIKNPAWEGKAASNFKETLKKLTDNIPVFEQQLALSVLFLASCADGYKKLGEDSVKKLKDLIGGQEYIDNFDVSKVKDIFDTTSPETSNEESKKVEDSTNTTSTTTTSSYPSSPTYSSSSTYTYPTYTPSYTQTPSTTTTPTDTTETKELKSKLKNIKYISPSEDEKTQHFLHQEDFKYEDGYAMINDVYLIACDSSIGKIGDVIKFTLEDGTEVTCIIVEHTTDTDTISFLVDKDKFIENEITKFLLSNSTKIENLGNCKKVLGIDSPTSIIGDLDMDNYPTDIYDRNAALERGTLVAKYLIQNGDFTEEQAAALVGVYVDENGCYPGDIPGSVKETEQALYGDGYGAGIGSWTLSMKKQVLQDAGYSTDTKIENLSLKEQCDLIIANSQKSSKFYYDALKRCTTIEDASATATIMTGGVGFSNNWSTHPTAAEAKTMAEYYASANDKTYGYSSYHHNADQRRLETAKEILSRLQS